MADATHVNPVEELASILAGIRDSSPPPTRVGELLSLTDGGGIWTGVIRPEGDPTQVRKVMWSGVGSRPQPGQTIYYTETDGATPLVYGSPAATGAQQFGADTVNAGAYVDGQGNLRSGITAVQGSLGDLNIVVDIQGDNLTAAQNAINAANASIASTNASVGALQGTVSSQGGSIQNLQTSVNSLNNSVNQLQSAVGQLPQIQSQIANLQATDVSLSNRIGSLEGLYLGNVIPQLQNSVNAASAAASAAQSAANSAQNTANSAANSAATAVSTANAAANSAATAVSTANAVGTRVTTLENRLAFYESNMTALANVQGQVTGAVNTANAASSTANNVRNAYNAHYHYVTVAGNGYNTLTTSHAA